MKKKLTAILTIVLSLLLCLCLAACGTDLEKRGGKLKKEFEKLQGSGEIPHLSRAQVVEIMGGEPTISLPVYNSSQAEVSEIMIWVDGAKDKDEVDEILKKEAYVVFVTSDKLNDNGMFCSCKCSKMDSDALESEIESFMKSAQNWS